MAFNVINEASKDSAAYSPIPFRFKDDDAGTLGYYNYLVYLIIEPTDTISVVYDYTNRESIITTLRPHKLKVGDDVVMYDGSEVIDNESVIRVISDDEFVVRGRTKQSRVGRYITYRQAPDVRGEASFDFSNTLRDFVESEYKDNQAPANAVDTKVRYEVLSLRVTQPSLDFTDDVIVSTTGSINDIGFIFPNTTVEEVRKSFKYGDTVNIEREAQTYRYLSSTYIESEFRTLYDFGGNICYLDVISRSIFGSNTNVYAPDTPQIIYIDPDNNGSNQGQSDRFGGTKTGGLPDGPPPYGILQDSIPYDNPSSITGGGTLTGQVNSKYNGITTIRDIRQVGSDVHIGIEKTVGYASPAVPGKMSLVNSTVVDENILYNSGEKYAFVGRQDGYSYDLNYMEPYVLNDNTLPRNFSTIYNTNEEVRIERSSKQNILAHIGKDVNIGDLRADVNYYDVNNNFLGTMSYDLIDYVSFGSGDDYNFYIPGNLNGWFGGTNTAGTTLLFVFNNVGYYRITIVDTSNSNVQLFNEIKYKIYDECSAYEIYELIWKDRLGSYLSYPFAFKHKETMEVTRNSYYKDYNGFQDDGSFELPTYRKGKKEFFVKSKQKFELNSGWATDKESQYIKDMFQSTDVYVKLPTGEILGCNILGNSIEVKKKQNFDLFNYKINIVTSLQDIRL